MGPAPQTDWPHCLPPPQVLDAVSEALEWLENNSEADPDEYKEKLKDVEDIVNPIVAKLYQGAGGEGAGSDDDLGDHDEL